MKLVAIDGTCLIMRLCGYQFESAPGTADGPGRNWDANWLVIQCEVRTGDGRGWSFRDPCLTAWEAQELTHWLRGTTTVPRPGKHPDLFFVEPVIGFTLEHRALTTSRIRAHFAREGRPPWAPADPLHLEKEYRVTFDVDHAAMIRAMTEWEQECGAFPIR